MVAGFGDGNREGLAEKADALDEERANKFRPVAGVSFPGAALSEDSRRL